MWTLRVASSPHLELGDLLSVDLDGGVGRHACEGNWCQSADISGSVQHSETVVYAIGAAVPTRNGPRGEAVAASKDTHWYIVAAEVEAGIIDETGAFVDELDGATKIGVACDWMRRNSKRRVTTYTAWCVSPSESGNLGGTVGH